MKRLKLATVLLALAAASALAGNSLIGRWAADPSFCAGAGDTQAQSPLVVTDYSVRWIGDTCRIGRSYRTGDTVHIEALCWSESGERAIPVSLRQQGDRIFVSWGRDTRGELRRCP
jgi:hypothetical protein